jgi:myosin heavy subunit
LAVLAAILHIADIEFVADPNTDGVFVKNEEVLALGKCLLDNSA